MTGAARAPRSRPRIGPRARGGSAVKSSRVVLVLVLAVLALAGEARAQSPEGVDGTLRYLPSDSAAAATFDTDLAGEELRGLDTKVRRVVGPMALLEGELRAVAREELGLDFDRDVRPLLGNRLVIGLTGLGETDGVLGAIEVSDPARLLLLTRSGAVTPAGQSGGVPLFRLGDYAWAAVREDEIVLADSRETLVAGLARRTGGTGLGETELERRIGELPRPSFVRGYVSSATVLAVSDEPGIERLPWVAALRTVGFTASAAGEALSAEAAANTDPSGLSTADLPLAPGPESPSLVRTGAGGSAFGLRDPAQVARFLVAEARLGQRRAGFGRDRRRVDRDLDVARDLVALLGSSAVVTEDGAGRVASRTDVTDPEAFGDLLRRPSAGAFGLLADLGLLADVVGPERRASIRPLRGRNDLYLLTAPGQRVVFGLVGARFVTAPDERAARRIAIEAPAPFEGPGGAAAFTVAPAPFGGPPLPGVGQLTGSVEAGLERVHLRLRLPVP